MADKAGGNGATVGTIYCIVPRDLALKLHEPLRDHFRHDRRVRVVVEFRADERRGASRRTVSPEHQPLNDRRRVRGAEGRRVADRRAETAPVPSLELPRRLARYANRLVFIERAEPTEQEQRDVENARLVTRIQSGDETAFESLYLQNFDAVYTYLRIALQDYHEAEDAAQQVFAQVLRALPRFELRAGKPFRAWLFTIARNQVVDYFRKRNLVEIEPPEQISRRRDVDAPSEGEHLEIDWIRDDELMLLIERLPAAQRQALTLRYMLGLSTEEMMLVLGRSSSAVRKLEHRALRYLEERLDALGRRPNGRQRAPMLIRVRRAPVLGARRFALTNSRR